MSQIKQFQIALNLFGNTLNVDGIYGPKTDEAVLNVLSNTKHGEKSDRVRSLQQAMNMFGMALIEDGVYGDDTKLCLQILYNNMKFEGHITGDGLILFGGRASTFGGKNDKNDRVYGQAFMPAKGKLSPQKYYEMYQKEWKVLHPDMAIHTVWPYTTDDKNNYKEAGISYFLDADGANYVALRLKKGSQLSRLALQKKVYLVIHGTCTKKIAQATITDWGPAEYLNGKRWRYDIDISPKTYKDIGLKGLKSGSRFGDHVRWSFVIQDE